MRSIHGFPCFSPSHIARSIIVGTPLRHTRGSLLRSEPLLARAYHFGRRIEAVESGKTFPDSRSSGSGIEESGTRRVSGSAVLHTIWYRRTTPIHLTLGFTSVRLRLSSESMPCAALGLLAAVLARSRAPQVPRVPSRRAFLRQNARQHSPRAREPCADRLRVGGSAEAGAMSRS